MASISTSMTARSTATSSACARSSRRSIPNSARSKPFMASVIDTATADTKPGPERASDPAPVSRPMPADAPAIAQPQSQASQQTRVEPTRPRTRLFDVQGKQIADSRLLRGPGDAVQVMELPPPERKSLLGRVTDQIYDWIVELLPSRHKHPPYRESDAGNAADYGEAMRALRGESGSAVRSDPQTGGLAISVAVPVQRYKVVLGAVMLSSSNGEIEEELRTVRLEALRIFG